VNETSHAVSRKQADVESSVNRLFLERPFQDGLFATYEEELLGRVFFGLPLEF
jgi:hypothetical protein